MCMYMSVSVCVGARRAKVSAKAKPVPTISQVGLGSGIFHFSGA